MHRQLHLKYTTDKAIKITKLPTSEGHVLRLPKYEIRIKQNCIAMRVNYASTRYFNLHFVCTRRRYKCIRTDIKNEIFSIGLCGLAGGRHEVLELRSNFG